MIAPVQIRIEAASFSLSSLHTYVTISPPTLTCTPLIDFRAQSFSLETPYTMASVQHYSLAPVPYLSHYSIVSQGSPSK